MTVKYKGQSAVEYLNIYTMAIIVIAISTSVGYSQLEDECVENVEGFESEQVSISEYTTDTPGSMASVNLENQDFDIAEIDQFEVSSEEGQRIVELEGDQLGPGDEILVDVPGIDEGGCTTLDVTVSTADSESEIQGSITGSFELLELELPEPPVNLNATL